MTEPETSTTRTRVEVEPDVLVRMGPLVRGSKGTLSPFRADIESLPGDVREKLVRNGIIDSDGAIRAENARAMTLLAAAERVTRVQLAGGAAVFEYITYFPSDGGSPVSMKTVAGGLRIEDPAATDDAIAYFANMVGSSVVIGTDFRIALPAGEAIVFASLLDEYRRSLLRTLANGTKQERPQTIEAIDASLQQTGGAFISVVSLVRSAVGAPMRLAPSEIDEAVNGLAAAGHVRRKGKGVLVAEAGAELARNFLNIETVLRLTAGREQTPGTVDHVGFTCGIAGLHDLLSIEYVDGQVYWETLTSRSLLDIIRFYLIVQNAITRREEPAGNGKSDTRENSAGRQVRFCGMCGKQRSTGDRFCVGCGAPF